jgi:hypothetical protein
VGMLGTASQVLVTSSRSGIESLTDLLKKA